MRSVGMLRVFADSTPEGWAEATAADGTPGKAFTVLHDMLHCYSPWSISML
jgi:hypothetical protein